MAYSKPMKFIQVSAVLVGMAVVLGIGIVMAVKGNPWLLIVSLLAGGGLFAKYGCATH